MKDARRDVEFSQQPHTADPEQHLLHDTRFTITTVKMSGDPAIRLDVLRNVCVEQIKLHSTDVGAPDLGQHVALADHDFNPQRRVIIILHEMNRQIVGKCFAVMLFLPTVVAQSLTKISVAIEQADRHERQTEITRRLEMIAGEYAETT